MEDLRKHLAILREIMKSRNVLFWATINCVLSVKIISEPTHCIYDCCMIVYNKFTDIHQSACLFPPLVSHTPRGSVGTYISHS